MIRKVIKTSKTNDGTARVTLFKYYGSTTILDKDTYEIKRFITKNT